MSVSPRRKTAKMLRIEEQRLHEEQLQLALQKYHDGTYKYIKDAAAAYGVPSSTLQDRLKGVKPRSLSHTDQQKLTPVQEEQLALYIERMANMMFPLTPAEVNSFASLFLQENTGNSEAAIGKNWLSSFLDRHPNLRGTYSRCLDRSRAHATSAAAVHSFFDKLEDAMTQYKVEHHQIYNMDETGFILGLSGPQRIVVPTSSPTKRTSPFKIQPGNRENITVIEAIGAGGQPIPPLIILKGKSHLNGWHTVLDGIPKDWAFGTSERGWTDTEIGMHWLQHTFEPKTRPANTAMYRILLLDGHVSHVAPPFIMHCWDHRIIPLCFPPHATHYLQPLDVSIFGPLTQAYRREVGSLIGQPSVTKKHFLSIYQKIRKDVINRHTAQKAFTDLGITKPLDRTKVLVRLPGHRASVTPPPTSAAPADLLATPTSRQECYELVRSIQSTLQSSDRINRSYLLKILKAYTSAMDEKLLLARQLEHLEQALLLRTSPRPGDRATLSTARVITREQVETLRATREQKEQEKADAAAARKRKAAERRTDQDAKQKGKQRQVSEDAADQENDARALLLQETSPAWPAIDPALETEQEQMCYEAIRAALAAVPQGSIAGPSSTH